MHNFENELNSILYDIENNKFPFKGKSFIENYLSKLKGKKLNLFEDEPYNYSKLNFDITFANMMQLSCAIIKYRFIDFTKGINLIREVILSKNKQYGNAILEPERILSKDVLIEHIILSRMDEKISRIINAKEDNEDAWLDLLGYSVFFLINRKFYAE